MPVSDPRLIVALDVADLEAAWALVARLGERIVFYKVGLGLLAHGGLDFARALAEEKGKHVFLDLKLFDIPATIEKAVRGIAELGACYLTVHGDPAVVQAAALGAAGSALKILAVTVLTSADRRDLDANLFIPGTVEEIVQERAARAFAAGADGVIAAALEAPLIRALSEAKAKLIVSPGIRPAGNASDDQKRIVTPAQALKLGVNHVVIGRPIWASPDPLAVTEAILAEMAAVPDPLP